ncbi:MAG: NfeD family protein [Paracoccaceae bacterium]
MLDLFGFLTGISPWWWVALALALGIVEVLTFSFFLIWPGLAALAVGILMWIDPDLSGTSQALWFAILSVAFTIAGRQLVFLRKPTSERSGLNRRSAALIGRKVVVVDGFDNGTLGTVTVDGLRWRARMADNVADPAPGELLHVTDADGMTLLLTKEANSSQSSADRLRA